MCVQTSNIFIGVIVLAIVMTVVRSGPFLDYCSTIPYNMLTQCNMTCATCISRN